MTLSVTQRAQNELNRTNIQPQIVVKIDGIEECFSATEVKELVRIGDPGLEIGNEWVIGGTRAIDGQKKYVSFQGSSPKITQQIEYDRGAVSSISSLKIKIVDKGKLLTQIISPGLRVTEILGRRVEVFMGFGNSAFPEDYIKIFAGMINKIDAGAGYVTLQINHPDEKKRQTVFEKVDVDLNGAINGTQTTINFTAVPGDNAFLLPTDVLTTYVQIGTEIIKYTGISGNQLTGCVRGQFQEYNAGIAVAHEDGDSIGSFYVLEDHPIDLALKIMLSTGPANYATGVEIKNFNQVSAVDNVPNAIFFEDVDIFDLTGVVPGDSVTTTAAINGANNGTFTVTQVVKNNYGSYIVVSGAGIIDELDTPATLSFSSKYNVLPSGLGMLPIEVDILEHESLKNGFLASVPDLRLFLKSTQNGKELIEKECFLPIASYALPRKTKSSVGSHIPPIPGEEIIILNKQNILEPSRIVLRRSLGQYFYNRIVFSFDYSAVDDEYLGNVIKEDAATIASIGRVNTFHVESRGMRSNLQAESSAGNAANRLLDRYRNAAEYFENIKVHFRVGSRIEPGDKVVFDFTDLFVSDTVDGDRNKDAKILEVKNVSKNLENGEVTLTLIDTAYDVDTRYGLISPASFIKAGLSSTQFIIEQSFTAPFGVDEWKKWIDFLGTGIKIRNNDFTQVSSSVLTQIDGNKLTVNPALSFTPSAGMIMEFADYNEQIDVVKAIYAFLSDDTNPFDDGGEVYVLA